MAIFRFLLKGKRSLVTLPLLVVLFASAVLAARFYWYRGYSRGSRTGVIRKLSIKGSPVCKYASAELVLQGGSAQQVGVGEVWEFTLDDGRADNPLWKRLETAERDGQRVTVHYRQDLENRGKFWLLCARPEYYVESLD